LYRSVVRLNQLADPAGGARTAPWRQRLAASVVVDLALWGALRRSERLWLWPRLALDAADTALWSLAPYPDGAWDFAVLPAVPFDIECGLRLRWAGMAAPALGAAATSLVRRRRGLAAQPAAFAWQVMAVGTGVAFDRYNRRVREASERDASRRRAAKAADAMVAGQNAVAMGADTVIDRIQATMPLLGRAPQGSALHALLDGWKLALAETTQQGAAYLGTVLASWQLSHNTHPDLSQRVDIVTQPGHGTLVLTSSQAAVLQATLTALAPRGETPVALADPERARRHPGRSFDLVVGSRKVVVPADPETPPRSPDFAPVGLALGALWLGRLAAPTAEQVPYRVVVPLMAGSLAAAGVAEHQLRRRGSAAHLEIQAMGLALAAASTILATTTAKRPFKESGGQNFPFYATLSVPSLMYTFHHNDLGPRMQAIVPMCLSAIVAVGWALAPRPRQVRQFLLSLSWPVAGLGPGFRVSGELRAAGSRLAADLAGRQDRSVEAGFRRGADSVVSLASAAYRDAVAQLDRQRLTLDPLLAEEAERRLEEVRRCLDELSRHDG